MRRDEAEGEIKMSDAPIAGTEVRISADSHVAEPLDLWVTRFPAKLRDRAPRYDKKPVFSHNRDGGGDPAERLLDMPVDNVTAEVLYPSIAATLFARRDAELAETIATIYNDWLIEYCQAAPGRLISSARTSRGPSARARRRSGPTAWR